MTKKIALLLAILFFQAGIAQSVYELSADGSVLNPPTRLETALFKQVCNTIFIALAIYRLDAVGGVEKETIIREHGSALFDPDVRFDLNKIDNARKGWTRYYPVTVSGEQFIVRIFLTGERTYQPELPVLFEISVKDPAVTCQVLPGINAILESHRIKPLRSHVSASVASSLVDRSP